MLSNVFIIWITLLPFIVWDGRYEIPKVLVLLTGGLGLACFWIVKVLIKKKDFEFSKTDKVFLLWLLILLISSLLGVHPLESIIGGSYRHQGVIFFFILWLIGKTASSLNKVKKKILIRMLSYGILLEALIVIIQIAGGYIYFGKPLGTLGEANAVAGMLAIGSYFVLEALPSIFVLLLLVSIISAESRAGILSFFVNCGILVGSLEDKFKKYLCLVLVILPLFLVILFSINKPTSFFENRITIWKVGVSQIMERPILGYGAESGEVVYSEAFFKNGFPLENIIIDRSHNLFIDVAMWSGLFGLVVFTLWIYFSYKDLGDFRKKFVFLSFLVFSMFQPLSVVHWILFFLVL